MLYDGKYTFLKDLGSGGFGKVMLAREAVSNRLVAIKQLKYDGKTSQEEIIHEIETVSRMQLPNVITYHHHFWLEKKLCLVMEYCAKGDLWNELGGKPADAHDAFLWTQIVAEAFIQVHAHGIIHHDIKPGNILFTANGTIKISDFGIANTLWGTRTYMSPELLNGASDVKDCRVDIYALGVTLMEMLLGKNPFSGLDKQQILSVHEQGDFPITHLPSWQQDVVLKAIHKVPELRFQTMAEFAEAIIAQHVPFVVNKSVLRAGVLAEKAEKLLAGKSWFKAINYVEEAQRLFPPNVNVMRVGGKYYLRRHEPLKAKKYFEDALRLNPRLDIQKELGKIHLDTGNCSAAISLLSDHLYRYPSDYEAYNFLLQCFYETGRYEIAMDLAKMMIEADPESTCFCNNYFINYTMLHLGTMVLPDEALKAKFNPFLDYNIAVVTEPKPSHNNAKKPTLKSKLLFQDYHLTVTRHPPTLVIEEADNHDSYDFVQTIIQFGRSDFGSNDFGMPTNGVSRRHCLIVNTKEEVILHDLGSTGTFLNGKRVVNQQMLVGRNVVTIDGHDFIVNTSKEKLV